MIRLTREFRFSLTLADTEASSTPDNSWAGAPSSAGLAPYLLLRVTLSGSPEPVTGYLCDIKLVDDLLRQTAVPFARQLLRQAHGELLPEVVLLALWRHLPREVRPGAELTQLELCPSPYLQFAVAREAPDMVLYTEQFEFSAAHRLHCSELSLAENRDLFGKCNNPNGHGHNYVVVVTVATGPEPGPEMLAARRRLGLVVKEQVIDRFDHKHLNEDVVEFRTLNPTVENIAQVIWNLLQDQVGPARLINVRVYETPKTWADCVGV